MYKFIGILLLFFSIQLQAQSPIGTWQTIDDNSGKPKALIKIYKSGDEYFGRVIKLLEGATTTVCDACPGDLKGKPIVDMVLLKNLKPYKYYWKGGTILDPKSGNIYGCSIWFEGNDYNKLKVRGKHWTGIYRDQTWNRVQ
jgi:uncharacterized protein (DUF2147 family)